jgi:hypothetical protein
MPRPMLWLMSRALSFLHFENNASGTAFGLILVQCSNTLMALRVCGKTEMSADVIALFMDKYRTFCGI